MYQVSSLGNVKSFKRYPDGVILKKSLSSASYLQVGLFKFNKQITRTVHQLVAEAFLNHKPNGYELVINHINFDRKDNRAENLEILTQREHSNLNHQSSSSKHVGVSWDSRSGKWRAGITIDGKLKHLGLFKNEKVASAVYQSKLETL
jgi:hypothetical protein